MGGGDIPKVPDWRIILWANTLQNFFTTDACLKVLDFRILGSAMKYGDMTAEFLKMLARQQKSKECFSLTHLKWALELHSLQPVLSISTNPRIATVMVMDIIRYLKSFVVGIFRILRTD